MSMDPQDAIIGGVSSNCCGASVLLGDMCSECKEHCEAECDHEWKFQDDSFDHEFGTERQHSYTCEKCGLNKPTAPHDYDEPDSHEDLRGDYLRDRAKDEAAEEGRRP